MVKYDRCCANQACRVEWDSNRWGDYCPQCRKPADPKKPKSTFTYTCHYHATHWTEDQDGNNPGCPICWKRRQPESLIERVAELEKQMQEMQNRVNGKERECQNCGKSYFENVGHRCLFPQYTNYGGTK